ncbi:MAG: sigma-54-dependent Fis family transcriptional regulator [Verrucomicrobia bacterium]|nr:sigma-54-dependent Fis family transcriptional regulator [Verrucomicrobiota bacterium]
MNLQPTRLLLVEDDKSAALSLERVLAAKGYTVAIAYRGDDGLARAQAEPFDVVLTDLKMPGLGGLDLIQRLHAARPRLPIILMTAHGTTETAIEATKHGAFEYLVKPFEMPELLDLLAKAAASARLAAEPVSLGETASPAQDALIGNSRAMQAVYKEIGRVAAKPVTVLIRGETGTGKELVTRALFQHSDRADKAFIAVNCAAIPETLLESELFGHERGAFTGAEARRIGRFEQAHTGTLFLDEIGDLSLFTQAKLLRVLQDKCIQRLGGRETISVDVRILAATHRDLEAAIAARQFREDLFYRLASVVIHLPPLRERLEDVPGLVNYFLRRFSLELALPGVGIQPEAVSWLQRQPWPGNVRQLANTLRQALLLAREFPVGVEHLTSVAPRAAAPPPSPDQSLAALVDQILDAAKRGEIPDAHAAALEAVERQLFLRAYELAGGNQAKAARWLNVSRQTMREKLTQFGMRAAAEQGVSSVQPQRAPHGQSQARAATGCD